MCFTISSSAVCMCGIGVLGLVCLFGGLGAGGKVFSLPVFCIIKKNMEYWLVLFRCKYWRALLLHSVVLDKPAHANVQCCLEDMHNLISFLGELSILKLNILTWLNH